MIHTGHLSKAKLRLLDRNKIMRLSFFMLQKPLLVSLCVGVWVSVSFQSFHHNVILQVFDKCSIATSTKNFLVAC